MSEILQKAREYEKKFGAYINVSLSIRALLAPKAEEEAVEEAAEAPVEE